MDWSVMLVVWQPYLSDYCQSDEFQIKEKMKNKSETALWDFHYCEMHI